MTITPDAQQVGPRADQILTAIQTDPEYRRLEESSLKYTDCWKTFSGYMTIRRWDEQKDKKPLFVEGLRVLALKSAIYESTQDEAISELIVPAPVDEMVHAIIAQSTLCLRMATRLSISFVHMTDQEEFGWRRGDYAHQCYLAAGWGEPNERYWVDAAEAARRMEILNELYTSIGIAEDGRAHDLSFDAPLATV